MIKKVLPILFVCLFLILSIIAFQWIRFQQEGNAENLASKRYLQYKIEVSHHKQDSLQVSQFVVPSEEGLYSFFVPKHANNFSCYDSNLEKKCNLTSERERYNVELIQGQPITFQYTIALDENRPSSFFENWFVLLKKGGNLLEADIEVTLFEKVDLTSTWVAGSIEKANFRKEHLNYYVWEKKQTTTFPLYKSNVMLGKKVNEDHILSVFSDLESSFSPNQDVFSVIPPSSGLTIISSKGEASQVAPLLVILDSSTVEKKQQNHFVIESFLLYSRPPIDESIEWMWRGFPSLITSQIEGDAKAIKMVEELRENVSESVLDSFANWLLTKGKLTNTSDLDKALSSYNGNKTNFFSDNKDKSLPLKPLYFIDNREIYINGETKVDWKGIILEKELYFPLIKIGKDVGFKVSEIIEGESYLIKKDPNSWRLYFNEDYFIFNEDSYGLTSDPLKELNDEVYVSENFLNEALKIKVEKSDTIITLD